MSAQTVAVIAAAPNAIPFPKPVPTKAPVSPATAATSEDAGDNIIHLNPTRRLTVSESMTNLRDAAQM